MAYTWKVVLLISVVTICVVIFQTFQNLVPRESTRIFLKYRPSNNLNHGTNGFQQNSTSEDVSEWNRRPCHLIHNNLNSCNTLPNYFLNREYRDEYRNAIINFWHIQKTGGSSVGKCLVVMNDNLNLPPTFHGFDSCKAKENMHAKKKYFLNQTYRPIIRGHGTLGACDFIHESITDRKCSTFAIFREPYERVVSHYFFNQEVAKRKDSIKSGRGMGLALVMNITDWYKTVGSVYFKPFFSKWNFAKTRDDQILCSLTYTKPEIRKNVFQDIAENLEKHISIIGLTEDLSTSYQMLEEAYNLPFIDRCSSLHILPGSYGVVNLTQKQAIRDKFKQILMNDDEVRKLMQFDIMLYEKAKSIFQKQKVEFLALKRNRLESVSNSFHTRKE